MHFSIRRIKFSPFQLDLSLQSTRQGGCLIFCYKSIEQIPHMSSFVRFLYMYQYFNGSCTLESNCSLSDEGSLTVSVLIKLNKEKKRLLCHMGMVVKGMPLFSFSTVLTTKPRPEFCHIYQMVEWYVNEMYNEFPIGINVIFCLLFTLGCFLLTTHFTNYFFVYLFQS